MTKPKKIKRTSTLSKKSQWDILAGRAQAKAWTLRKRLHNFFARNAHRNSGLLFIFGCQRSGTGLLSNIIDRDIESEVLHENSRLTLKRPRQLRLKSVPEVRRLLDCSSANLICVKPLVESQHALKWLAEFEGMHAIWIYRNYHDLILSHLRRFSRQIQNIAAIANDEPDNWRNENISEELRAIVGQYFHPEMTREDAAGLHWYIRNSFFFSQSLADHPRVHILRYESLVADPQVYMCQLYQTLGRDSSIVPRLCQIADTDSVGEGSQVTLSPGVQQLCQAMQDQLDEIFARSQASGGHNLDEKR